MDVLNDPLSNPHPSFNSGSLAQTTSLDCHKENLHPKGKSKRVTDLIVNSLRQGS